MANFVHFHSTKAVETPDDFEPFFHMPFMKIKVKDYPLILLKYIFLISETYLPLDIFIAIGLGFITNHTDYYYLDILNDIRIKELEQKSKINKIKESSKYLLYFSLSLI